MKTRWTGFVAGLLLLVIVVTGLYLGTETRKQFIEIDNGWSEFSSETDQKGALISAIRGHLGYGGIIHTFKNYVLRQDDAYRLDLLHQFAQFDRVVTQYLALPIGDNEREALMTIVATVNAYREKLPVIGSAEAQGWSAEDTDRMVRVDDAAAFAAFDRLEKIWLSNRQRQSARLKASVDRGQELIAIGFASMALLVAASLMLAYAFYTILRQMQVALNQLSDELRRRKVLERRTQRLAQAVEQSPATIIIADTSGHIEYVNRQFEVLTGWAREEIVGQTPKFLQTGQTSAEEYRHMRALLAAGKTWIGVLHNRKKDGGSYWAETTILPLREADGTIHSILGIGEDITERLKTREQMARAQKIEAVGLLAGGIAHDFNSVLTSILGSAHLAALDAPEGSDLSHEIEQIDVAARRAQMLVQQLLGFARRKSGNPVPTEISDIIEQALRLVRAATPSAIEFTVVRPPEPVWVAADPTQLLQVIMNLCSNAAEAIGGASGTVQVSVAVNEMREPTTPTEAPFWVTLTVEDDGPGMTEDVRRRVFDAFYTTKPLGKGTGLGLAVVNGLVGDMGGAIEVESVPGQGACFRVILPGCEAAHEGEAAALEDQPYGTERLLVVDDEADIAATLRRSLMRYGYQIEAFSSANAALRSFNQDPDRFDAVITDVIMPELNGIELAGHLRTARPALPVVLLTGYSPSFDPIEGPEPLIVPKPVDPKTLARQLRRYLDKN